MEIKKFTFWNIPLLTLLAVIAGLHQAAAQNFVLSSSPGVGIGPLSVIAADLNGDGKLDLITANYSDNTLTVLTNSGGGVFGSNATYTVGNVPYSIVAADVNNDGKLDLIAANNGNNTLTVLTNNGDGNFTASSTNTVGNAPAWVAAAILNGDGKMDLISANYGDNSLTVLTNNGSGVFGSNATYTVGLNPQHVEAVNVNGSGKPALISANFSAGTLTVLTNNGSGEFGSNATYNVGSGPGSGPITFAAADVNGDGKVDLITANLFDNTLTVLTNNGSGGFVLSGTYNVGVFPESVAAADVNGDGKVDLISANVNNDATGNTLTVLTNNGDGTFTSSATLFVGIGPTCVVAADVNGDGTPDLITSNFGSAADGNTLTVLLNLPALEIQSSIANTALVSWFPAWPGYVLQANTNLSASPWSNVSNPTGTNRVTISPATGNNLFRLRHP